MVEQERPQMTILRRVCACVRACNLANLACKENAPYYVVICGLSGSTKCFDIIT